MSTVENGRVVKRRLKANLERPKKRHHPETDENGEDDPQAQILLLENEILESKKHYNNIATLIGIANNEAAFRDDKALVAAVSLARVFIRLLAAGSLNLTKDLSEKEATVARWLRDRLVEYKDVLKAMITREEWAATVLTLSMRLLKAEGEITNASDDGVFPREFFADILAAVLEQLQSAQGLLNEFVANYIDKYDDLRYYTFKVLAAMLQSRSKEGPDDGAGNSDRSTTFENAFALLSSLENVPGSRKEPLNFYIHRPKKSHSLNSVSQHKKQAQEAWMALLNLDLTKAQQKQALGVVSTVIAPWLAKPELLMDFLTDCYNADGSMSLLALSGVFYLIQEKNLDYPDFYRKLYSLLDADILHSKHRSRFFRLMDTFLNSSHLPAQLVASFVKRLARLCLNAPPSAIVAVVPWIYNMFKKHPLCTFMIHRVPRTQEERDRLASEGQADPFLPGEEDPMETGAIDSCLWEVVQLQSHYHPNVATIAKIISEQFTKQFYSLEDFLDHSYGSVSCLVSLPTTCHADPPRSSWMPRSPSLSRSPRWSSTRSRSASSCPRRRKPARRIPSLSSCGTLARPAGRNCAAAPSPFRSAGCTASGLSGTWSLAAIEAPRRLRETNGVCRNAFRPEGTTGLQGLPESRVPTLRLCVEYRRIQLRCQGR